MKDEVRYVVTANYSPVSYSVACNLVGVYRAEETAKDKVRQLKLRGIWGRVSRVVVGAEYPVTESWCGADGEINLCSYME